MSGQIAAALIGLAGAIITLAATIGWSMVSRRRDDLTQKTLHLDRVLNETWMATIQPGRSVWLNLAFPTRVAEHHLKVSMEMYELALLLAEKKRPWIDVKNLGFGLTLASMQDNFHRAAIDWLADPRALEARFHFVETVKACSMALVIWRTDSAKYRHRLKPVNISSELMEQVPSRHEPCPKFFERLWPH